MVKSISRKNYFCLMLLVIVLVTGMTVSAAEKQTVSIAVNDSPWLPAFREILPDYEQATGVTIKLNVFPYNGLYEKLRTSVMTGSGEFDIMFLDDCWVSFFFSGNYATPLTEIDPDFELDPEVIEYNWATRWNAEKNYSAEDGRLFGLPINGNLQLFYYRKDLLEEAGLAAPETWDDVLNIAQRFHDPQKPLYGFVTGGQRGNRVVMDWLPILRSHGGDIFANLEVGDCRVIINNDAGKKAINMWLDLMTNYGPTGVADVGQSEVIAYMATGRAVQAIIVAASHSFMDQPDFSTIPGKVDYVVIPRGENGRHATTTGGWVMAIPRDSKNKEAALDFMKWAVTKDVQMKYTVAGSVPIRADILRSELAERNELRFLNALSDSWQIAVERPRIPEWYQVEDIMGLYLNQALIDDVTGEEALDLMAEEIYELMKSKGYRTGLNR